MAVDHPEPTRRDDLAGLLSDIASLEQIFADWDEEKRSAVMALRRAIEALHGEALRRLIRALKLNPEALAAMKTAAGDEVVYAVLRRHGVIKPSLNERIDSALEAVRPMLASHGGDVEVLKVEPPRVDIGFNGACDGCAASTLTFLSGVRKAILEACPEITEVVHVRGREAGEHMHFVSPFALGGNGPWLEACPLPDIPDNGLRPLNIGGRDVVLFRRGKAVTCFDNACAHLGQAIHEGKIEHGILTCPHHGFRYDLASGECLTVAELKLQAFAVRVIAGRVEVRVAA